MKHAAALFSRLAVYAAALFVVATARLPQSPATISAFRAAPAAPAVDPVRLGLAGVLLAGIVLEALHRRPLWH